MSREQIGLFGLGQIDIWNNPRAAAYVRKFSPQSYKLLTTCDIDISPYVAEPLRVFTNPADDNVWWLDGGQSASYSFLGLMVTKISGLSDNVLEVKSTPIASYQTISYSPPVNKGFTITVEGILWGLSCCGVEYGFRRLRKELAAMQGINACRGTTLRMLSCVNSSFVTAGGWVPPVNTDDPWRTVFNVKLVEQPSIVGGSGHGCGCGCQPLTRIIFTLRANGEIFRDSEVIAPAFSLRDADAALVMPAMECDIGVGPIYDPGLELGGLPTAPLTPLGEFGTLFTWNKCVNIASGTFDTDIEMFIYAGDQTLRNVRVRVQNSDGKAVIAFALESIPAGVTWAKTTSDGITLDGVSSAMPVLTVNGLPGNSFMRLPGDSSTYTVCIETDQFNTADDATLTIRGRAVVP